MERPWLPGSDTPAPGGATKPCAVKRAGMVAFSPAESRA